MKPLLIAFFMLTAATSFSQSISIEFPAFAGKTYDFIIFQGSKQETVIQDTIPANGKFTLKIPEQYAPYTGMSRWLITRTEQGGGLDMAIPGHDFSVTCLSAQPSKDNIVYTGFDAVNELNTLNTQQQKIIEKFTVASKGVVLYADHKKLHKIFSKEALKQKKAFAKFHKQLKNNPSFNARFLPIVNLTRGIPPQLTNNENEKAEIYNQFITQKLNFNDLYVSGHWTDIIRDWVGYQSNVVKDKTKFAKDFKRISDRITNPTKYTDFIGKLTYYLTTYGKDDYVEAIAETVIASDKVTAYLGSLQVYKKSRIGSKAPDLQLPAVMDTNKGKITVNLLKSSEFALGNANQTLLIFYNSDCGHCQDLLSELFKVYDKMKANGLDVIAISSDEDPKRFKEYAKSFPWQRTYDNLQGMEGINYKNYGVIGTPTMFLIDRKGIVVKKPATLKEVLALIAEK